MRQGKIENYMDIAEAVSKRSHDVETQVGSILIKNDTGAIIATGFNGFVRGAPDDKLPNTRPEKYKYVIHAEQNIIAHCARHGISMDNCVLVCTLTPCANCMRMLWQCGITSVIAKTKYRDFEDVLKIDDISVKEEIVDGFVKLTYSSRS